MGHDRSIRQQVQRERDPFEPAVSQLIRHLIESDAGVTTPNQTDEVILDIEVGGVRYVTIRCASHSPDAPDPQPEEDLSVAGPGAGPSLTPREIEIARMVAKGYANKSIASILDISTWTVSSHLRRIFSKLGVTSRAAMVARLLQEERAADSPTPPTRGPHVSAPRGSADVDAIEPSNAADSRDEQSIRERASLPT